jgi:site-specific recombinase XerD
VAISPNEWYNNQFTSPQNNIRIATTTEGKTAIEEWQNELVNKADETKTRYQAFFSEFLQYIKTDADALLIQRQKDVMNPNLKIQRSIETQFLAFINKKKQEGYSISTQQVIFASIRSFFECHYFPLKIRRKDYPKGDSDGAKRATKEAILKLLDKETKQNSQMYKAVIHTLNDSGLRIGDLRNLNCRFYLEALKTNPNTKIIQLNIIIQKTKLLAKTFFGEEAIQAIKDYLEFRKYGTQKIPPETITAESPLFRSWRKGTPKRIGRSTLSAIIENHFSKIGETKMSAHSFRKKLQTDLEKSGVNTNWIDQILGHALINSRDAYSLPTDEELKEAYTKAYQIIRIYPEIPQATNQIETQKTEILEIKANDIQAIKQALLKGYKHADTVENIRLYMKSQ